MPRLAVALSAAFAAGVVTHATAARAQYNVPAQATGDAQLATDRTEAQIAASPQHRFGWELGASLDFLTRDRAGDAPEVKFTDVVLLRLHGLVALGERGELFGGVELLPKQPSTTDELVWQGALLGVRRGVSERWSGYLRAQLGPGLGRDGAWLGAEAAAQARVNLAERVLFWESTLGGTYTQIFPERGDRAVWQTELLTQTGVAVRDRRGAFASWLTFSFHFPLVGRPLRSAPDPVTGAALDPQTRVDVALGMLVGVNRGLDLFLEAAILDRGDLDEPRTTLPILSAGSDRRQLLFGFNRRFGARRR